MIIVIKELPDTTPRQIIDWYKKKYEKEGKTVKTRHEGNRIQVYEEVIF